MNHAGHIIKVGTRAELSSKLRVWKEHSEMFKLRALGRAGLVSLGTPISEDFFVLESTLRFWIDSTCCVALGTIYMAC